jgi:hypothetical protein
VQTLENVKVDQELKVVEPKPQSPQSPTAPVEKKAAGA